MKTNDVLQVPADTPLSEELASDDVVEMANLTTAQTGVTGTIFISRIFAFASDTRPERVQMQATPLMM
jgi:hypothetical protein